MNKLLAAFRSFLDKAREVLKGEPLRAIVYGAAVLVFFVSNASGRFADLTFDEAVTIATTASVSLVAAVETARRYVTPVA